MRRAGFRFARSGSSPTEHERQNVTDPAIKQEPDLDALVEAQRERIRELEAAVAEMDERSLELEQEVARRGVKLSCANIALARAKIAFDETSRTREEAVQDIAHDLRTPLTSIKGATQNLLDGIAGPLEGRAEDYVEIIHDQSERLIGVVNWLVEAMRNNAGALTVDETPLDLAALVARCVRQLEPIAQERDITLSVEVCPATLPGDAAKLQRVFENLVHNALKFTDAGGEVAVRLEGDESSYRVLVKDTGIGMSDEVLDRIFDRYYRKPSREEGTGLGLVISRQVARLHGGDITVRSVEGEGSELTVHLPRG